MAQTLVSFRMDPELKRQFEETCGLLGMTMTTAFTMLAQKMVREQRLPFEVNIDPAYAAQKRIGLRE
ncbi:MAG TPA: type II toxin-antitoxin system antitoxin, RelB/DinJ family [Sutterella sp.]|nr:type II toxin-antitoxin system antitoxin, RelB/DinJ family [Sutterella sp.]